MAAYDLLIVTDETASMGTYLEALATAVPEILALGTLSGAFQRVGLLSYTDYSEGLRIEDVVSWSGWDNPDLKAITRRLTPRGGGDVPEACKTALSEALLHVDATRKTLVLWYADAGPHHVTNGGGGYYSNSPKEVAALAKAGREEDWVKLSKDAARKNCTIFSIVQASMPQNTMRFFALLSELTGGKVFTTPATSSAQISQLTLDLLLAWMGEAIPPAKYSTEWIFFEKTPLQSTPAIENETALSQGYLPSKDKKIKQQKVNTVKLDSLEDARFEVDIPLQNLSKKFLDPKEDAYRNSVHKALEEIIVNNVVALTYNPVFGQLWRAVCKDRTNKMRDTLVNAFSQQVGRETDAERRKMLTEWLEESYNSEGEIQEIIDSAPDNGDPNQLRIYLDLDSGVKMSRAELLEVARSLFPGVLKRLASILTHIKLVEKDVVLHPSQRSIPLSLKSTDLFKILPHLVVSGTLFSGRAAALFAALSMVVGVPFLDKPARDLLGRQKGGWLDLEIPENLSYECAKLLMSIPPDVALSEEERLVYAGMRRYRLIELNIQSSLNVTIPWTPELSSGVGDYQLVCKSCQKKRSVTIMADDDDICGFCAWERDRITNIAKKVRGAKDVPIVKPENEPEIKAEQVRWVECSVHDCRAQYVVLNPHQLRVRPKCHYCRNGLKCPWVECQKCSNRVIIPERYRQELPTTNYQCFACQSGKKTIVEEETNTRALIEQNGRKWLGFDDKMNDLFQNMSAFKIYSKHGAAAFTGTMEETQLTFRSKKVFNGPELRLKIEGRVETGEVEQGTCSLCFDDSPYHKLLPACGRSGCKQRADDECLRRWYAANEPGKLLNPLQLACPFCRRSPVLKTLTRYNPRAIAVGDLKPALADRAWYWAWCLTCGFAKQAVERACADAGLPEIQDFVCETCRAQREALRARLEQEARDLRAGRDNARLAEVNRQIQVMKSSGVSKITPCPRCGVYVQKTYGCNHITCNCGTHFCFVDGLEFSADKIYDHLNRAHGGIGIGDDSDGEEDDDY